MSLINTTSTFVSDREINKSSYITYICIHYFYSYVREKNKKYIVFHKTNGRLVYCVCSVYGCRNLY